MSFSNKFFIYFFITLFATKIVAQDFLLDQITVSANRVFTPVNETGAIVDVIDEEIIQNKKATFLTQIYLLPLVFLYHRMVRLALLLKLKLEDMGQNISRYIMMGLI